MYRQTYLEVDCNKLKNNIIEIKNKYPNYNYYIGVVKGNAYGHGTFIVNSLIEGGINYLAVSSLEEALKIREYNTQIPILVLEPINQNYLETCVQNNITITICNLDYFKNLITTPLSNTLKFHIKLDTGMSRLGLQEKDQLNYIISNYTKNNQLFLEGIFTHFATSGLLDKHWDNQLEKFKKITQDTDLSKIPMVHLGRSMTLVNHEKIPFCNGIRLGIAMYGMSQSIPKSTGIKAFLQNLKNNYKIKKLKISPTTKTNDLKLQTAITLYSEVIDIRAIKPNNFVGYGATYTATQNTYIATLPIGYADGIPKTIKHVFINGKKYNIVGVPCMDMITCEVDNTVKLGDKAILIDNDNLPVKTVARECNVTAYSLFTNITTRVPRVYKKDDIITEIKY